jgi:2-polyprenyl-6-methoxyphenol hydroxylase-like FAD-dependent oxidoreductase
MDVIIAGGGIGGLAAALALHAGGHDVRVFEAVSELRPLGVGINVLSHAVAVLADLGLMPALAETAIETRELRFVNRHGQTIWRDPRGRHAGLAMPQFSIHRGELQMILLDAVRARLGADRVRTSHAFERFEQRGGRVIVTFVDRETGREAARVEGDVLVGADGIHSAVRRVFHPDEGPPRWNGILMGRGVTEAAPFLGGDIMIQAGYSGRKFVCYPISKRHAKEGWALLNWVADLRKGVPGPPPERESWNRRGSVETFLPHFADWRFDWLDVPALIRGAEAIYEFPMVDRDPLDRWSHGLVTLLGDAAHPMYPIGSNGATQSILDAAALAQALGATRDAEAALRDYEAARMTMVANIVRLNRQEGIDRVLDLVEARAPDGFDDLEAVLPAAELQAIVDDYKRAAGHAAPKPAA